MTLTNKVVGGSFWAFLERSGAQVLQIIIFVVLARILTPTDFGLIGMITIFIELSQRFVDSGFGQALIQKKNPDEIDYSSVFFINFIIGLCLYGIIFLFAPLISNFYREPQLTLLTRVLGLQFVIAAFSLVQTAKLTKEISFKKLMWVKLPSTLIAGAMGITAAYMGLGVWSLVIYQLVDKISYTIQIWIYSSWKPFMIIHWKRVRMLFDYGGKLMLDSIISTIYNNLYELAIGRYFSTAQVGFFTQANRIQQLPVQNISITLERVSFPILSNIQDDNIHLKKAFKKIIRQVLFILTPIMIGGIVLAEPLFNFVLTEKWLPAVSYFQILCISGLFYPLNVYNLNILKVKGRSDLYLYLGLLNKGSGIIIVLVLVQYSVMALVIFNALQSIYTFLFYSLICGKLIDYNFYEQVKDVWLFFAVAIFSGFIVYIIINKVVLDDLSTLFLGGVLGFIIYIILVIILDREIIDYTIKTLKNFSNK